MNVTRPAVRIVRTSRACSARSSPGAHRPVCGIARPAQFESFWRTVAGERAIDAAQRRSRGRDADEVEEEERRTARLAGDAQQRSPKPGERLVYICLSPGLTAKPCSILPKSYARGAGSGGGAAATSPSVSRGPCP